MPLKRDERSDIPPVDTYEDSPSDVEALETIRNLYDGMPPYGQNRFDDHVLSQLIYTLECASVKGEARDMLHFISTHTGLEILEHFDGPACYTRLLSSAHQMTMDDELDDEDQPSSGEDW